jgi:hypothetical protein
MFYDAFAALIAQAGDALETRDAQHSDDPRFRREGRQIATFLRRTGAVWSDLFTALQAETRVLEEGHQAVNVKLRAAGCEAVPLRPRAAGLGPLASSSETEPLERYRAINRALDEVVERLTPRAREPWAKEALGELRASLARAAAIQGQLVDRMLEIR